MSDVERIAPPIPTLPPPVGRNVGERGRKAPDRAPKRDRAPSEPPAPNSPDHIDEYA